MVGGSPHSSGAGARAHVHAHDERPIAGVNINNTASHGDDVTGQTSVVAKFGVASRSLENDW